MVPRRGDHGLPRLRLSHDLPPPLQLFRHRLQLLHQLLRHALQHSYHRLVLTGMLRWSATCAADILGPSDKKQIDRKQTDVLK